jgi:hypothetical protein
MIIRGVQSLRWRARHDPFDPRFADHVQSSLQRVVSRVKGDPWCPGYFVDNERPPAPSTARHTSSGRAGSDRIPRHAPRPEAVAAVPCRHSRPLLRSQKDRRASRRDNTTPAGDRVPGENCHAHATT